MTQVVDILPEPTTGPIPSYGLGLMHFRNAPLGDSFGHGGGGPGYTTYATHFPNLRGKRVSIAIVLNKSMPQTPFSLANDIINHYVEVDTR